MALITCPECGKENISEFAKACPECGFPIAKHFSKIDDSQKAAPQDNCIHSSFEQNSNTQEINTDELSESVSNEVDSDNVKTKSFRKFVKKHLKVIIAIMVLVSIFIPAVIFIRKDSVANNMVKNIEATINKEDYVDASELIRIYIDAEDSLKKLFSLSKKYIAQNEYYNAYFVLSLLYNDNADKEIEKIMPKVKKECANNISVGKSIFLGEYEQNNDITKKKDIEWIVLKVEDGAALLISNYVLDAGLAFCEDNFSEETVSPYWIIESSSNYFYKSNWYTSSYRKWLNDDFYNKAFTKEEKAIIKPVTLYESNTIADNVSAMRDNVFAISTEEAEEYISKKIIVPAVGTDYAHSKQYALGVSLGYHGHRISWWLRTHSNSELSSMNDCVMIGGSPAFYINSALFGARPTIKISISDYKKNIG